jgi:predicted ester cyclase
MLTKQEEENKAKVLRLWAAVDEKEAPDPAVWNDILDPNFVYHGPGGAMFKGPAGFQEFDRIVRKSFSDTHMGIGNVVAEGNIVISRYIWTCKFTGPIFDVAPTGKEVGYEGIIIDRFEGGKIVEEWEFFDMLDWFQQLGVLPLDLPSNPAWSTRQSRPKSK